MLLLDVGRAAVKREAESGAETPGPVYYRFLARSVLFAGLVIAPAGICLLAGWPGWEQIYWTERVEDVVYQPFNALLPALFVFSIVASAWLGHHVGYTWLATGREKLLRPTYIGLMTLVLFVVLVCYPSFTVVGTYQEYVSDPSAMPTVWSNPHGFLTGWLIVMVYFTVAFAYTFLRALRDAKLASSP